MDENSCDIQLLILKEFEGELFCSGKEEPGYLASRLPEPGFL
jgi:hypothetical protein